jgi:hypothetical protein
MRQPIVSATEQSTSELMTTRPAQRYPGLERFRFRPCTKHDPGAAIVSNDE